LDEKYGIKILIVCISLQESWKAVAVWLH